MDKYIELAKKLKALSDLGVGGEKVNAQYQLSKIMEKYNITVEDLDDLNRTVAWFKVKNQYLKLFIQVAYSVVGKDLSTYSHKRKRSLTGVMTTKYERIEIEAKFAFYKNIFIKESKAFYEAFINVNHLFPINPFDESDKKEPTPEELEQKRKAQALAMMMVNHLFSLQIESNIS